MVPDSEGSIVNSTSDEVGVGVAVDAVSAADEHPARVRAATAATAPSWAMRVSFTVSSFGLSGVVGPVRGTPVTVDTDS